MKIFVTGATGFIGSHLVNIGIREGHEIVALRLSGSKERLPLLDQPRWINGSLEDDVAHALDGCEAMIHLAAYGVNPADNSFDKAFRWNVTASLNLWEKAFRSGIKRLVIAGSCSEYGKSAERYDYVPWDAPLEPVDAYGASKAAASVAALAYGINRNVEIAILRPFHVYGDGENSIRFWPSLKAAAIAGEDFKMTLGEQVRDFTSVEEVARAFLSYAAEKIIAPGMPIVKNLGTGKPETLRRFAERHWKAFNAKGKLVTGAVPYRKNEVMRYVPML